MKQQHSSERLEAPTVIIAAKSGRLGNRLFLSAYFMANALAKGYRLLNPALGEYMPLFEGSATDPLCRFPTESKCYNPTLSARCAELMLRMISFLAPIAEKMGLSGIAQIDIRTTHDEQDQRYDLCGTSFDKVLKANRWVVVKGWKFRDDENLIRFHPKIRAYFRPVESVRRAAESAVESARALGETVVGVHVRQGDYRGWKNGAHYFETEQYAHWMRELKDLFPEMRIAFLICASDPIDKRFFHGLSTIDGPGGVASDLHALSLCDAIMGPPSTFSTWASYYGKVPFCMLEHAGQKINPEHFVLHNRV